MVSLAEAARILGVPVGQVARLIDRLIQGELGVPPFLGEDVATLVVRGGWISVDVPPELGSGWPFHAADAACMIASLRAVRGGLPRARRDSCDALIARLQAAVDPEVRAEADLRSRALAWAVSEAVDPDVVSLIAQAAEGREVLRLTVYNASRDALQTRDVWALLLLQHGESWYLCARDPDDRKLRWWRVDRVLSAVRTGQRHSGAPPTTAEVRRPVLYDVPTAPLLVEVRFDPGHADRAEAVFGLDGEGTSQADGSTRRTIRTPKIAVLIRRLLEYGTGWEIVGPEAARAEATRWAGKLGAPAEAPRDGD